MKKIAIITINYNNAAGLEHTIKSVIAQRCPDCEFIVVDGGSTDHSQKVIEQFSDRITTWVSEKDNGIYHAQNKGIALANAEYCLFLNSGDLLADEQVLNSVIPGLKDVDILYGDIISINDKGTKNHLHSPDKIGVYEMMISTLWHPGAFIKREIFGKFGCYNEDLKITGDYEFFIRTILKHNVTTRHIKKAIAIFDLGGVSNAPGMNELQTLERRKSWELNFSDPVIEVFEYKTRLLRSREYKLGKWAVKILRPFLGKK